MCLWRKYDKYEICQHPKTSLSELKARQICWRIEHQYGAHNDDDDDDDHNDGNDADDDNDADEDDEVVVSVSHSGTFVRANYGPLTSWVESSMPKLKSKMEKYL